jgi:hypothetical protein
VEHLSERQQAKLTRCLEAGDPDGEVEVAWRCYQQLRSIYHATTTEGRRIAEKVIAGFPSCPIPEVARLGRTLKAWRPQLLAYFDTSGVSNSGTEAINLIIERRFAGLPTDSKTLIITGFESSSPQTDHATTGTSKTTLKSEEPPCLGLGAIYRSV